jgi:hypothetical protein
VNDPWAFGWTPLLAIVGYLITIAIAFFGFRTFKRWRREVLEEKKIEIALEAMALAHESKYVFTGIRSPMSYSYEWKEMPKGPTETDQQWDKRGSYYAILSRINRNRDFFERLFKLQPRFMALFGAERESTFLKCHEARRFIEVSAQMLMRQVNDPPPLNANSTRQRNQWEADIWEGMDDVFEGTDRVSKRLREFKEEIIALCAPLTRHQ